MSDAVGKVVARVETEIQSEYGDIRGDAVRIVFTDGSALEVVGASYEEVDQSVTFLSPAELAERERELQRAIAEHERDIREREELQRQRAAEWKAAKEKARGELTPEMYEGWLRANKPTWVTDAETAAEMARAFAQNINRQLYASSALLGMIDNEGREQAKGD